MAVSPYFNNFNNVHEQGLVEDLIIEAIQIYGYNVMYLPRTGNTPDIIFNEDSSSEYDAAYQVEMYIKSYDGYDGDGAFLSKFGIEVRNQLNLTVAIKTFVRQVGRTINTTRPLEGDLIYFALDNKLFVIKKVNKYDVFYQSGSLQSYDLTCEVFEYSGEKLNTGIAAVDAIEKAFSPSTMDHALKDINGNLILDVNGKPQFDPTFNLESILGDQSEAAEIATTLIGLLDATDDNIMSEDF